jgi:8-oxo-dGTP pyrophosphatase MutT (NUDIX family)
MAFPGGRAEPGDAGLSATAMREVAEEIGLDLQRDAELLGALDEVQALARMRPMDLTIQPFVFNLHAPAVAYVREEVTSVHWLSLEHLLGAAARGFHKRRYGGQVQRFPCARVEGLVIWGLTYRMLLDLGERLKTSSTHS